MELYTDYMDRSKIFKLKINRILLGWPKSLLGFSVISYRKIWMNFLANPILFVGDVGSILGLGRSPGGGHGNSLQYSCLENPHGQRSLVGYSPWGHKESDTTERLSTAQQYCMYCSTLSFFIFQHLMSTHQLIIICHLLLPQFVPETSIFNSTRDTWSHSRCKIFKQYT